MKIDPEYAETLNNLGALYEALDNIEFAKDYYSSAVHNDPNFPFAHYNLARIHARLNNLSLSLKYLNRSIALHSLLKEEASIDEYLGQVIKWDTMRIQR